jgi:hypothetical protein
MCSDLLPIAPRAITVTVGALVLRENGRKSKARVERMSTGWWSESLNCSKKGSDEAKRDLLLGGLGRSEGVRIVITFYLYLF